MSRDCNNPLGPGCVCGWGTEKGEGLCLLGELQAAPALSLPQDSSLRVPGSCPVPRFSDSVGAEGVGEQQSLSAGTVWPGQESGIINNK